MRWGQIKAREKKVLIVATGPSLRPEHLPRISELLVDSGIHVIAVNRAIEKVAFVNSWFTLDPSSKNQLLMAVPVEGVTYYAAVPNDFGKPSARVDHHREPKDSNAVYLRRITGNGPWSAKYGLSEVPWAIHTGNSAWGALGVAYLMFPKWIVLLGVDGTQEQYGIINGRPKNDLSHLPNLFATALAQLQNRKITVLNGSSDSKVTCFPRNDPISAVEWLKKCG